VEHAKGHTGPRKNRAKDTSQEAPEHHTNLVWVSQQFGWFFGVCAMHKEVKADRGELKQQHHRDQQTTMREDGRERASE
jgi:hypothetical protein